MTIKAYNELGFAVLSPEYLKKIMGEVPQKTLDLAQKSSINVAFDRFGFDIKGIKETGNEFDGDIWFPDLQGENIQEHFEAMAKDLAGPSERIIRQQVLKADLSEMPSLDNLSQLVAGHSAEKPWLKLVQGKDAELIEKPDSDWLVLDFETFVQGSLFDSPIIGSALGTCSETGQLAAYLWVHDALLSPENGYEPILSSIGEGKVVIMHNAAFDAALFKERYTLNPLNNWCYCTMAMNVAVAGLDGSQRWAKHIPKKEGRRHAEEKYGFLKYGCGNALVDAYEFHTGKSVAPDAKDPRMLFVQASQISEIAEKLEICLQYAMNDVIMTLELFQALWPEYVRTHCKSRVARVGHNMLINSIVPVRDDWETWLAGVESVWQKNADEMTELLNQLADGYHEQWANGLLEPETDIWLKNLDWRQSSIFTEKKVARWYEHRALFGEKLHITGKSDLAHYLLKLKWRGLPIQKTKENQWHVVKEDGTIERIINRKQDGSTTGSLLNSYHMQYLEDGTMSSADDEIGKRICHLIEQNSFYTIMRDRVRAIRIVPIENPIDGKRILLAAPRVNPGGALTLRCIDPIFVVLAAHCSPKPCAELKACVRAPSSYQLVGLDIA